MKNYTQDQLKRLDLLYCDYNEGVISFEQYESKKLLILNS